MRKIVKVLVLLASVVGYVLSLSDYESMRDFVSQFSSACTHYSWSSTNICDWAGVNCNSSLNVVAFAWQSQRCTGRLSLAHLPSGLKSLIVNDNEFEGNLELKTLPDGLVTLQLSDNNFSGSVDFTALPSALEYLMLDGNKLSSTVDLTRLPPSLKQILLSRNDFEGDLNLFTLPKGLVHFESSWNRFSGSVQLSHLPESLQVFDIRSNRFSGFTDFSNLPTSLQFLHVENNQLEGGLPAAAMPADLREIFAESNLLSGSVEFTALPAALTALSISGNRISGSLNLTRLPSGLTYFDVSNNSLSGAVDLCCLPSGLQKVWLQQNQLNGTVVLEYLPAGLTVLMLQENSFSGPLSLLTLPSTLQVANLSSNSWSGPLNLSALPSGLSTLDVSNSGLSGALDLTALPDSMAYLYLHSNLFSRGLELRQLNSGLTVLDVCSNGFSGSLNLSDLPFHLLSLNVSNNTLSGELDLSSLNSQLVAFSASRNHFSGLLNLSSLPGAILFADLSANEFTSVDLARMPSTLKTLLIDWNRFTSLDLSKLPGNTERFSAIQNDLCGSGMLSVSCSVISLSSLCVCESLMKKYHCKPCTTSKSVFSASLSQTISDAPSISLSVSAATSTSTATPSTTITPSRESPSWTISTSASPSSSASSSASDSMSGSSSPNPSLSPDPSISHSWSESLAVSQSNSLSAPSITDTAAVSVSATATCSRSKTPSRGTFSSSPSYSVSPQASFSTSGSESNTKLSPSPTSTVEPSQSLLQTVSDSATEPSSVTRSPTVTWSLSDVGSSSGTTAASSTVSQHSTTVSKSSVTGSSSFTASVSQLSATKELTLECSASATGSGSLSSLFSFSTSSSFDRSYSLSSTADSSLSVTLTPSPTSDFSLSRTPSESQSHSGVSWTPPGSATDSPTESTSHSPPETHTATVTIEFTRTDTASPTLTIDQSLTNSNEPTASRTSSMTSSGETKYASATLSKPDSTSPTTSQSLRLSDSASPLPSRTGTGSFSGTSESQELTSTFEPRISPAAGAKFPLLLTSPRSFGRRLVVSSARKSKNVTFHVSRDNSTSQYAVYMQIATADTFDKLSIGAEFCNSLVPAYASCFELRRCVSNPFRILFPPSAPWLFPTAWVPLTIEFGTLAAAYDECGAVSLFVTSDRPVAAFPLSYFLLLSNDTASASISAAEEVQRHWRGGGSPGIVSRFPIKLNTSAASALEAITFLPLSSQADDERAVLPISNITHSSVVCSISDVRSYDVAVTLAGQDLGSNFSLSCEETNAVRLHHLCEADPDCLGYVSAAGGLDERGLCLLFPGTGLDPFASLMRLVHLRPNRARRTCSARIESDAEVQVFIQQTYLASSRVMVSFGTSRLTFCGQQDADLDGACSSWVLCVVSFASAGSVISVTADELMESGGCSNTLGAIFAARWVDVPKAPSPTPSGAGVLPATVASDVVLIFTSLASLYTLKVNMLQLLVAQTGFQCARATCPPYMVSLAKKDEGVALQKCGGIAGFDGNRTGLSDECDVLFPCGSAVNPITRARAEFLGVPEVTRGSLSVTRGTIRDTTVAGAFTGWVTVWAETFLTERLGTVCRHFAATLIATGPQLATDVLHGFVLRTDLSNIRPLFLVRNISQETQFLRNDGFSIVEVPFLFSTSSPMTEFTAFVVENSSKAPFPGFSSFGCVLDVASSSVMFCDVPVPFNATNVRVLIAQGRFTLPSLTVSVGLVTTAGSILSSATCGGRLGFSGGPSLDHECHVFGLCFISSDLKELAVAVVRLSIPREVVAKSPCDVPFLGVVTFGELPTVTNVPCQSFFCSVGRSCLPLDVVCDGVRDCPDGADEEQCGLWQKIEERSVFTAPRSVRYGVPFEECRAASIANRSSVFAFGMGQCLVYSDAERLLRDPTAFLQVNSSLDLFALLPLGPLSYAHCTPVLCSNNGVAVAVDSPLSTLSCKCICSPGFSSDLCAVSAASAGWNLVAVRNFSSTEAQQVLSAIDEEVECESLQLNSEPIAICTVASVAPAELKEIHDTIVSTLPPFAIAACTLTNSTQLRCFENQAYATASKLIRITIAASARVTLSAQQHGKRRSEELCGVENVMYRRVGGCVVSQCSIADRNTNGSALVVSSSGAFQTDPCYSPLRVETASFEVSLPRIASNSSSGGSSIHPVLEIGSALAACGGLVFAFGVFLIRKRRIHVTEVLADGRGRCLATSLLLFALCILVTSAALIMSAPVGKVPTATQQVLLEVFAESSCAASFLSPQPFAMLHLPAVGCQPVVATDGALRSLFGSATCLPGGGAVVRLGQTFGTCNFASPQTISYSSCDRLVVANSTLRLFARMSCTTREALSAAFSQFDQTPRDTELAPVKAPPASAACARRGSAFVEYRRIQRLHRQVLKSSAPCRFEAALNAVNLGELVSQERFIAGENSSRSRIPRDGDFPVGFTYNLAHPDPSPAVLGRNSARYFGIAASPADLGRHFSYSLSDRSGWTVKLYMKAGADALGFPFAVVDSRVMTDGRSLPLERLLSILTRQQPEAAWRAGHGTVYSALFVSGTEHLAALVWAGPAGIVRWSWSGLHNCFDGAWHNVAIVARAVNGQLAVSLIIDGMTYGEIDGRLISSQTVCSSLDAIPPPVMEYATMPVSKLTAETVWNTGALFAGYFKGGVAHLEFSPSTTTIPDLWQALAEEAVARNAIDGRQFAALGAFLLTVGLLGAVGSCGVWLRRGTFDEQHSHTECSRRFSVLSSAAAAEGYANMHWSTACRWLDISFSDFTTLLEVLESHFPRSGHLLLLSLLVSCATATPISWTPPDPASWEALLESRNAAVRRPPTEAAHEPHPLDDSATDSLRRPRRPFSWMWPVVCAQTLYVWLSAMQLPPLFDEYFHIPLAVLSADVAVADLHLHSLATPLLQCVFGAVLVSLLPAALFLLRDAVPLTDMAVSAPVLNVAASAAVDDIRRNSSQSAMVADGQGYLYEVKPASAREVPEDFLPVTVTDSEGTLGGVLGLVGIDGACLIHRQQRLGLATDGARWACSVVSDGQRCGHIGRDMYMCGRQAANGAPCPFALCEKHFSGSVWRVLIATATGHWRMAKNWRRTAAVAHLCLTAFFFTPLMRSSFMLLSSHPFFRCSTLEWDGSSRFSGATVVTAVGAVLLYGVGVPLVMWRETAQRERVSSSRNIFAESSLLLMISQLFKVAVAAAVAPQLLPFGRYLSIALSELVSDVLLFAALKRRRLPTWQCVSNGIFQTVFLGILALSAKTSLDSAVTLGLPLVIATLLFAAKCISAGFLSAIAVPLSAALRQRRRRALLKRFHIEGLDESNLYVLAERSS
jgi:hypothetical protein